MYEFVKNEYAWVYVYVVLWIVSGQLRSSFADFIETNHLVSLYIWEENHSCKIYRFTHAISYSHHHIRRIEILKCSNDEIP